MKAQITIDEYTAYGKKYANDNIIYSFRSRTINPAKPIKVYRNLHNNMYSIKQQGLVVAHAERLCISNCKFIVNEKGRQKVIKEKKKNVHAYIEGKYTTSCMGTTASRNDLPVKVTYNPYLYDSFINTQYKTPVKGARAVILSEGGEVRAAYTF